MDLHIQGTNPNQPGSFTRFVLPFSYRPALWKGDHAIASFYIEGTGVPAGRMVERRAYFTAETGMVLFDRAKWCVLKADASEHTIVGRDQKKLGIRILPPRIVLPEWPAEIKSSHARLAGDLLRTGFLLRDVEFQNNKSTWELPDVLAFNETFRYWRRPWPGQDKAVRGGCTYREMVPDYDPNDPYFGRWEKWLRVPVRIGDRFFSLVPGAEDGTLWVDEARKWQATSEGKPKFLKAKRTKSSYPSLPA